MKLENEIKQKRFRSEYHKLVLNIIYTGNWIYSHNAVWLKKHDLSPQQYNILRILRGQHPEPVNGNLLRERMLDKMSNISRLVEKLRLKELLDRKVCKQDRRAVDIIITRKGLELLERIDIEESGWIDRFSCLSVEESALVNNLLDKLRG